MPQVIEAHEIEAPIQILQEPELNAPQPLAEGADQPQAGEQEKQLGDTVTPISAEHGDSVDESESSSEPISKTELVELEKEIRELRALLEMSAELRGEVEKLARMLKGWKTGKTVN